MTRQTTRRHRLTLAAAAAALFTALSAACTTSDSPGGLPLSLPFPVTRPEKGTPLTADEVAGLTLSVTGLWKKIDYFNFVLRTSHGWDGSGGKPEYAVWWDGADAYKSTEGVTFTHNGGSDNTMISTSKVLSTAAAGYLLTGDPTLGRIVELYSKGTSATMMGLVWDNADPDKYIMARAVFNNNYEYVLDGGRKKSVNYTPARHSTVDWNTHTIHVPNNPYWGDIWVKNMRSKDDIPHIYRANFLLHYVAAFGKDAAVRDAAKKAVDDLRGFARDVVDHTYNIRTKDENGQVYIITDQDLSSFTYYLTMAPKYECPARLVTALLAYGDARGIDCAEGDAGAFDDYAASVNYYNRAIIRGFHMDAVLHTIRTGNIAAAKKLMEGLIARIDKEEALPDADLNASRDDFNGDFAVFLVQAAAAGVPLTADEARWVQTYYTRAVSALSTYDKWDLWDAAVPAGYFGSYRKDDKVNSSEIGFFLEYCYSPFRNPTGAQFVDCDIVRDPSRW